MEDYSKLKGGIPATSASERVWGVPKKRKATDRNPDRGRPKRESSEKEKKEDLVTETEAEERPEPEELGYGSHGIRKKRNVQVDVII